jgi:nitrate reductase delta subunit
MAVMGFYTLLAEALRYPYPGQVEALRLELAGTPEGPAKKSLGAFLDQVQPLSLGEREELHTRTLDLSPLATPYVGFQAYGESYPRGNFMALMNQALAFHEIPTDGELPDHLIPVLRYLGAAGSPLPELAEILLPAVQAMQRSLKKSDPSNPYGLLLQAVEHACRGLPVPQKVQP